MRRLPSTFAIFVFVMFVMAAAGADAGSSISSRPGGQAIVIDGATSDWEGVELHYFEQGLHTVGVTHDAQNLYVMWRFGDERLARQVLARGVTVWVNGDGKKRDGVGVRYAGSLVISESLPTPEGDQLPPGMDSARARRMRRELTVCTPGVVTVFDTKGETDLPESNENGPVAASAIHDGVYMYEVRIPFATAGGDVAAEAASDVREVAVGFQLGGLSPAEQEAMQDEMRDMRLGDGGMGGGLGGRPGGGMPVRPGGGMGSGMGGGPTGSRLRLGYQEIEWLRIKLLPVE